MFATQESFSLEHTNIFGEECCCTENPLGVPHFPGGFQGACCLNQLLCKPVSFARGSCMMEKFLEVVWLCPMVLGCDENNAVIVKAPSPNFGRF